MNNKLALYVSQWSVILMPILLISGPFLADFFLSLSSLFFLVYLFQNKIFKYFNKKPLIIFFIFCIFIILVSIFRAEDVLMSFESSLFYFRIGVFACLVWYLIEQNKNILNYFYYSLSICFLILVIDGYYQFFNGSNIFGFKAQGVRIASFFGDELILGSYLSRLFPILFALFLIKKKTKYEEYYIGILFVLIDVLIYMTAERTAFFFLNISTIFIIVLIKKYQKFRLVTFLIALILISILTYTSDDLSNRMIKDPISSMGLENNSEKKNLFSPSHDSLMKTAYIMFRDKPIFGHGPKMFRVVCKNEKYQTGIKPCLTHPHNFYFQLLAETGFVGFLFLFSVLLYVFYCGMMQLKTKIFKQKKYLSDYQVCLLAAIFITVWPFSPNGNFFNNWLAICYSLSIGFYLHSIYGNNRNELNEI